MTGNTPPNPFGSTEPLDKQYGVTIATSDEEELRVALGAVCESEIAACLTGDNILG